MPVAHSTNPGLAFGEQQVEAAAKLGNTPDASATTQSGFRFAHITDLHLFQKGRGEWHNYELFEHAVTLTNAAVDSINAAMPAFVVVTGDLTHFGSPESFDVARAALDRLKMPYFVTPGNHDTIAPGSREAFLSTFAGRIQGKNLYQSWEWNNWRFISLDPYWLYKDGGVGEAVKADATIGMTIPAGQLEWLEQELTRYSTQPTILFNHHPLLSCAARYNKYHPRDAGILANSRTILTMLRRYPQVVAYFSGHQHYNQITNLRDGESTIMHCITSAMIEYPMMWRDVTLTHNSLSIDTIEAPIETLREESLHDNPWTIGDEDDRVNSLVFKV
jgi:3',5'-cyclic AMP phosphodiesterase CpdA